MQSRERHELVQEICSCVRSSDSRSYAGSTRLNNHGNCISKRPVLAPLAEESARGTPGKHMMRKFLQSAVYLTKLLHP
jgi:hypothetical protein